MRIDDPDNVLVIDEPNIAHGATPCAGWIEGETATELLVWWREADVEGRIRLLTRETEKAVYVLGLATDPSSEGVH
ncbi:MAG: hypothetical protein AAGC46_03460, partial [Solirubrobacteraceae bacterium]